MISDEVIEIIFFITMSITFVILIAFFIYCRLQPYEDVNPEEAYKYDGKKIRTEIKAVTKINNKIELEFLMPVIISNGKTTNIIYIPILEEYQVFTSNYGIYLAFEDDIPQTEKLLIVEGVVKVDKFGKKFVIKVDNWKYYN